MKRLLITSCFMLFAGLATFAQAIIKFDKNSHNFGTFTEDKPVSFVFSFTNIGDKPLVIQQAFTSCGFYASATGTMLMNFLPLRPSVKLTVPFTRA